MARVTLARVPQPFLNIAPRGGAAGTLLVFYGGGLVRPQAYEWLGRALAARGVQTVIPVFPFDLAVTDAGRAGALIARFGSDKRVVLAGHSLGGAVAAGYAAEHAGPLSGLVLMAADVRGGLSRLPPGTTLTVLPGAVQAFFGRYGPQRGAGQPGVTREQAEREIVAAVSGFLNGLPPR